MTTPEVGELCYCGEEAFEESEYEEAVAWYELACAGTMLRMPGRYDDLVERRFERYAELRKMVPWRSVQRLSAPDPGHVLGIMACEGRSLSRLWQSIHHDLDRWRGAKVMVIDGRRNRVWRGWNVQSTSHTGARMGQAATFFALLQEASSVLGFTALTLLEDDVVLARNALDYIATTRIDDDLAFISWFSREVCTIPRIPPVLSCRPALHYDCNQAITFPARTVHELLASDVLKNWSERHNADRIYGMVFPNRPVAVHFPNLAQHVGGLESLVGNEGQGERVSPSFIGEGADALRLLAPPSPSPFGLSR